MPVQTCRKDDRPGFKWGPQGFCYTYQTNNQSQREQARARAEAQGRAIEAEGGKNKGFWKSLFKWADK